MNGAKINTDNDFCECLVHPFQNDPGVSQHQRVIDALLSDQPKIDARKMADLLDYFYQLSRQINYYDNQLNISDWQPFFSKSIPFVLAGLIKYNASAVKENFDLYNLMFEKKPSPARLQLSQLFIYYNTIRRIQNWHSRIKGSELPVERIFENIIKDKIRPALAQFIALNRLAANWFGIAAIDFKDFLNNETWNLPGAADLAKQVQDQGSGLILASESDRLLEIHTRTASLFNSFFEPVKLLSKAAGQSLEQSFIPLKAELQKQHLPHLGLLFAFLKLFGKLQNDLNGFTKKHLDFFYKEVLKLKPKDAVPDKAHIIFEIQKELDKYPLAKGLLLKDGKDLNKQEILFSLDDEMVVNKAKVKDIKTLYLNNRTIPDPADPASKIALLEGVYMASDAAKADGVDKDFQTDIKNFYTVGDKESKYLQPGSGVYKPYPNARLGFILASPVLLLHEGKRTVTITLQCLIDEQLCNELKAITFPPEKRCCGEVAGTVGDDSDFSYLNYLLYTQLFPDFELALNGLLNTSYYYVSEELIALAVKKGLSSEIAEILRSYLVVSNEVINPALPRPYCYCPIEKKIFDTIILADEFENYIDASLDIVKEFFKKRKPFSLLFSGEKEWISPSEQPALDFTVSGYNAAAKEFTLTIEAVLNPDKDPVSFYNKEKLKEDFNTTDPLVKIELDDHFKIEYFLPAADNNKKGCCLDKKIDDKSLPVSLYQFFKTVKILPATKIEVQVCGLNNFIVQNDESVMDVNGPVYPFGARPEVIDFDIVKSSKTYCINQAFIDDAVALNIHNNTRMYLEGLIAGTGRYKVGASDDELNAFLNGIPVQADRHKLEQLFNASGKNYCQKNFIGPNFYIGSQEVFCKNWTEAFINLNWKDKPVDFNEYYLAYWADPKLPPDPPPPNFKQKYGLNQDNFEINLSVLQGGKWKKEVEHPLPLPAVPPPRPAETAIKNPKTQDNNRKLFPDINKPSFCNVPNPFEQTIYLKNNFFDQLNGEFHITAGELKKYDLGSKNGFLRINLQNQDFLHKDYAFVLARQMMALGKYPDSLLEGAVYRDSKNGTVIVFSNLINLVTGIEGKINAAKTSADTSQGSAELLHTQFNSDADYDPPPAPVPPDPPGSPPPPLNSSISDGDRDDLYYMIYDALAAAMDTADATKDVQDTFALLEKITTILQGSSKSLSIPIPNEPWTPIIQNMSIDYKATATIGDLDLIHLYPYKDTYKPEVIRLQPTMLPAFCDEGTLFIGLENLVPGSNLNILFQLAEATADSELDKEDVHWHYLDNNVWKPLRTGFEVLNDATENLTTTGIIKFAMPENMTNTNTVMPKDLHWIKATIPKSSKSVSEATGIHAQAMRATFTNDAANDKLRLDKPIEANQISKLETADASVKQVLQPYETFGGQVPEEQQLFYVRVSELLRHKGRAIQKFDYERIVLDAFPQLFKTKCINHSFGLNAHLYKNDFPYAPGYILLAVIPDLNKLKAGNVFEPKAPVSLLEKIDAYIRKRTSPFVRFRSMNPRYEKIHFCLKVRLVTGKDENYYKEKLKEDIREFLAPWAIGDYYKLTFGQCVNRSNIVGFLESLDYIDFILALNMRHESVDSFKDETNAPVKICPTTPRSILIAGDIDVCIDPKACEKWDKRTPCDHETIRFIECRPTTNQ